MWDELDTPWQICLDEAWTAYRSGCIPIGALVTDADGQVLTRGRNHIYEGGVNYGQAGYAPLAHAEMEALNALAQFDVDPHSCVLYTTTEPCPMCLGAWYISGVRRLHYASRDPWAGSAELIGKSWYLSRKPVQIHGPQPGKLEDLILALSVEFFSHSEGDRLTLVYQRWAEVMPRAMALGRKLCDKGTLGRFVQQGRSTAEMVDAVAGMEI